MGWLKYQVGRSWRCRDRSCLCDIHMTPVSLESLKWPRSPKGWLKWHRRKAHRPYDDSEVPSYFLDHCWHHYIRCYGQSKGIVDVRKPRLKGSTWNCRKCIVQSWPGQCLAKSEGSKECDSWNKTQSLGGVNYKESLVGDLDPSYLGLGFWFRWGFLGLGFGGFGVWVFFVKNRKFQNYFQVIHNPPLVVSIISVRCRSKFLL